jgi:L-seryl-tRNA(Ser) seleniumtransferase
MFTAGSRELRERAHALREKVGELETWIEIEVVSCDSAIGGGAMPDAEMPSWGLSLRARDPDRPGCSATAIDRKLRAVAVPVIGRIAEDCVVLDVRTIAADELDAVAAAIRGL